MSISAEEAGLIRQWNDSLTRPVSVRLLRTRDKRSGDFEAFLDHFGSLAPMFRYVYEEGKGNEPPAIFIGKALRFHLIPGAGELMPFLKVLSLAGTGEPEISESVRKRIEEVQWPADLKVYVTPQCPFCPQVLSRIAPLPLVNPILYLTIIDGALFPEMAARDSIRSVPTLILDDQFRWTGTLPTEELLDALMHRDPSRLSAKSLEDILKDGNAGRLARMMLDQKRIFAALPDLLTHSDWSIRLGAMVVMEEIAEEDPQLASEVLPPIWKHLETVQDSVKGDILYLSGILANEAWVSKIEERLRIEKTQELREVLEEALDKARSRL